MSTNRRKQGRAEKKSRNLGRFFSFMVHAILLIVFFLPFIAMKPPVIPSKEALVIQFDYPYNEYVKPEKFIEQVKQEEMKQEEEFSNDMDPGSKMSGSEGGGSPESTEEQQQSRPQSAAPARLSTPTVTTVAKTNNPLRSNVGEIPLPTPKINTNQAWQSVNDFDTGGSDGVEEMQMIDWSDGAFGDTPGSGPGEGEGDDDSSVFSDGFGSGTGGNGGSGGGTGNTTGAGSGPGGGTGTGNAGRNTGVGQDGNGLNWGVGVGDGLLNRKLLRRANVESLAVKEGKIGIYICVDRSGMVLSTKYDLAGSTLKDPEFVKKAEECAKSYMFVRDDEAPEKQCGKLTFVFKIKQLSN